MRQTTTEYQTHKTVFSLFSFIYQSWNCRADQKPTLSIFVEACDVTPHVIQTSLFAAQSTLYEITVTVRTLNDMGVSHLIGFWTLNWLSDGWNGRHKLPFCWLKMCVVWYLYKMNWYASVRNDFEVRFWGSFVVVVYCFVYF